MTQLAHITIRPGNRAGSLAIHLDGHDISHQVNSLTFQAEARTGLPSVTLELPIAETDIDTPARVVLHDSTADMLVRYGRTPPTKPGSRPDYVLDTERDHVEIRTVTGETVATSPGNVQ